MQGLDGGCLKHVLFLLLGNLLCNWMHVCMGRCTCAIPDQNLELRVHNLLSMLSLSSGWVSTDRVHFLGQDRHYNTKWDGVFQMFYQWDHVRHRSNRNPAGICMSAKCQSWWGLRTWALSSIGSVTNSSTGELPSWSTTAQIWRNLEMSICFPTTLDCLELLFRVESARLIWIQTNLECMYWSAAFAIRRGVSWKRVQLWWSKTHEWTLAEWTQLWDLQGGNLSTPWTSWW